MGAFWIVLVVSVVGFIIACMISSDFLVEVSIVGIAIVVIMGYSLLQMPDINEDKVQEYELTIQQIDTYTPDTDIRLLYELYKECCKCDDMIQQAQKHSNSIFIGRWYAKELKDRPLLVPKFNEKFASKELITYFYNLNQ